MWLGKPLTKKKLKVIISTTRYDSFSKCWQCRWVQWLKDLELQLWFLLWNRGKLFVSQWISGWRLVRSLKTILFPTKWRLMSNCPGVFGPDLPRKLGCGQLLRPSIAPLESTNQRDQCDRCTKALAAGWHNVGAWASGMAAVGKVGLKAGKMLKPYQPPDLLQVFEGGTPPRIEWIEIFFFVLLVQRILGPKVGMNDLPWFTCIFESSLIPPKPPRRQRSSCCGVVWKRWTHFFWDGWNPM